MLNVIEAVILSKFIVDITTSALAYVGILLLKILIVSTVAKVSLIDTVPDPPQPQ